MRGKCPGILAVVLGLFLLFCGTVVWAAKIKITIDPATGKPVVKSDVPVVSTTKTPEGVVVVTLATGEKVGYTVTPTGTVSVQAISGVVNVVAGNVAARVEPGEAVAVKVSKETGAVQVIAQRGTVEVSAQGKRVKLKAGQQTKAAPNTPPSPPAPAPSVPPTPAAPVAAAPAPAPTPVAAAPAPAPKPPKYQVDRNVPPPPPAPGAKVEEFHGEKPASPAE